MSGGKVAYNLRPNKYVERQLFVELLGKICTGNPGRYVYVSMGGPQLEDLKLVHHALGLCNLVSLEADPVIHQRQLFNLRPSYIVCKPQSTTEFATDFDAFTSNYNDKEFIIWLDYAAANERLQQLTEFRSLLGKLEVGDVLKITLNANPGTLGEASSGEHPNSMLERRFKNARIQLDPFMDLDKFTSNDMNAKRFPIVLCNAIRTVFLDATQHRRLEAVPIAIFLYQDGNHQMLTYTVTLRKRADVAKLLDGLRESNWDYTPTSWDNITHINVPNLTPKERLHIEEFLFSSTHEEVHSKLPFRFAQSEEESLRIFEEYARHYRRYPSYFQVIL